MTPEDDCDGAESSVSPFTETLPAQTVTAPGVSAPGTVGPRVGARWTRYEVRRSLGAGGMGVVFAAYDGELDREVALKVLHDEQLGRAAQERLRREARAMARIAHPNVVPVYEVGEHEGRSYYTMELVRGGSVKEWLREVRGWRDVQRVFLDAARGLAAIHAAGLVHRDVKPGNLLLGEDGRARVTDLGIAAVELEAGGAATDTTTMRGAGTPAYMAPEQLDGAAVDARADQFAFGVALHEALHGGRPVLGSAAGRSDGLRPARAVPRWLDEVVQRAVATRPEDRFPDMASLITGLTGPRTRRWRYAIVAGALAAVVVAGTLTLAAREDVCSSGSAQLAETWGPAARAAALTRLSILSSYGRGLMPRLAGVLDEHDRRWVASYRDACVAHQRGVQSDTLFDRRMACLERSRSALAALAEMVSTVDAGALPQIALAARALPEPETCADVDVLISGVEPPPPDLAGTIGSLHGDVERARMQVAAGRFDEALRGAERCVGDARVLGYRPLLAEALLVAGHARMSMDDRPGAVPVLNEASTVALAAHADAIAVEAWARRAWAQGTGEDPAGALEGLEVIETLAARTPSARFARALLYNNVGSVELARHQPARARAAFERALVEARGVTGPGAIELLAVYENLSLVAEDLAQRDAPIAQAEAATIRLLGADHPETLAVQWMRATTTIESLAAALQLLVAVCEGFELHQPLASRATRCWAEVGYLRHELGDSAGAVAAMERAVARGAAHDSYTPDVVPYLTLWRGVPAEAARQFEAAVAAYPQEHWWQRNKRAELQLGLGRAYRAAGDPVRARSALEASISVLAPLAPDHPSAKLERRLGRARIELVMTLRRLGAPSREIAPVAAAALTWLRQAGGRADEITAVVGSDSPR